MDLYDVSKVRELFRIFQKLQDIPENSRTYIICSFKKSTKKKHQKYEVYYYSHIFFRSVTRNCYFSKKKLTNDIMSMQKDAY